MSGREQGMNDEMTVIYPAIFDYQSGKEISVVFPDLDVATSGRNYADAIESAEELLKITINGMNEDGKPLPRPTPVMDMHLSGTETTHLISVKTTTGFHKEKERQTMDERAIDIVRQYISGVLDTADNLPKYDIFIVWKCKALQNWKYLISTTIADGMYYELTYNGDKKEWYLDAYKKWQNVVVKEG